MFGNLRIGQKQNITFVFHQSSLDKFFFNSLQHLLESKIQEGLFESHSLSGSNAMTGSFDLKNSGIRSAARPLVKTTSFSVKNFFSKVFFGSCRFQKFFLNDFLRVLVRAIFHIVAKEQ